MLDIKCSFLEESAVSPAIMVYHLPETVSEISLTNLSVITCLNSLHLNRWRKLSWFFGSHKDCSGCKQSWWITQQPAPLLDSPSQTNQTNSLIVQVPIFPFLFRSSHFSFFSRSLENIVGSCLKNTWCFTVTQSSAVLLTFVFHLLWLRKASLLRLGFLYLSKWGLNLKAMQEQKQFIALNHIGHHRVM